MNFRDGGLRRRRAEARMDLTPLIDVLFQLLVFFLLTASFVAIPNIKVELPRASGKATTAEQRDLTVVITREGTFQIEGRDIGPDALRAELDRLHGANPDARVLVQADAKTYHERVVQAMDAAKAAGFTRLGVATRPGR